MTWLAVGLGGALGSMARHAVNVAAGRLFNQPAPYATAVVNVCGCFVIGLLAGGLAAGQWRMSETSRAFVFVGVLGGFTTFSSFGLDTLVLIRNGAPALAAANIALQVIVGLAGVFAGYRLMHG